MAKVRRIIRKLKPAIDQTFDDQVWPVNAALIVLGAYLMGVALAVLRFDDPRFFLNAATWLTAIPLVTGLTMWAMLSIPNQTFRRALQLSIVLSLIINLTVLVIMAWLKIFTPPWLEQPQVASPSETQQIITVPEYQAWQVNPQDRERQEHEKPVETGMPDATQQEVERQESKPTEQNEAPQPDPTPDQTQKVEPHAVARKQPSETAPRQSDQQSKLSRQVNRAQPHPSQQAVAAPQPAQIAPQRPSPVEAQTQPVQRNVTEVAIQRPTVEVQPTTQRTQEVMKVARREAQQTPRAESTATPTMQRQMAEPKVVPRTSVATAEAPSAARQTQPNQPKPNNVRTEKQDTSSSPAVAKATAEPTPETPTEITSTVARRQAPAETAPTVAQAPSSTPSRKTPTTRPSVTTVAAVEQPTQAPTPNSQSRPQPAATSASLSRQATRAPATDQQPLPSDVPSASPSTQVARATPRRAAATAVPTLSDSPRTAQNPSRATRSAPSPASPTAVASPSVAQASRQTSNPTAQPARTALTRSTGGVAGVGAAPNLDRSTPAPDSPSVVASASARRPTSMQRTESGPAIAPSEPARISRSLAGADAPSAAMTARPVEVATVAGASQPQELQASASAALSRSAANAPSGPVTAMKGTTDVDLGPTRVVANEGRGKSAGGGQPTLNQDTQARKIARSETGGSPQMAIAATVVADVPEAPPGDAGGQPSTPEAVPQAPSLARTQEGGQLPTSGGPTASDQTGPPEVASSAEMIADARVGRAEVMESAPGPAEPGGGSSSPVRSATGPSFTANTQTETVSLAGDPASSGQPDGAPLEAQGIEATRAGTAGVTGLASAEPAGALAGPTTVDAPTSAQPGSIVGQRQSSPSSDEGPAVGDLVDVGSPSRRTATAANLPSGTLAPVEVDVPLSGSSTPTESPDAIAAAGMEPGPMSRNVTGALPVHSEAPEGPGGVAGEVSPDVGLLTRQAMQESQDVTFRPARFVRRDVGGPSLAVNTKADVSADAFRRPRPDRRGDPEAGGKGQPSPQTEEAIDLGLVFLSRHQSPDGSWSLHAFGAGRPGYEKETAQIQSDTAGTSLALLSYLGAGFHHRDFKYQDVVRAGLNFLVENQKEDGDLYVPLDPNSNRSAWLYSHGMATMAICEAYYGMTQDPWLREPAQKALDFVVASQHKENGGWRYLPGRESDTSVSGWMLTALKSGELAYLTVPKQAYDGIDTWLNLSQASGNQQHLYRYNPLAPETRTQQHGRLPSTSMTSVAMLMRLYRGWQREDPNVIRGADELLEHLPAMGTTRNPERDTYYWYYATQVMFHMKGRYWEEWNNRLHPLLADTQIKQGPMAGSWNPKTPVPDRWGPHGGRLYVTTLNLLSLEVYYRHLPLYVPLRVEDQSP